MSVAVGLVGLTGASIAADSADVDLLTGTRGSCTKVVKANGMIAAMTGVARNGGHDFIDDLRDALGEAPTPSAVPKLFLLRAGADLVLAYQQWRHWVGPSEAVETFCNLLAAGREGGRPVLFEMRSVLGSSGLTLEGDRIVSRGLRVQLAAIGSTEPIETRLWWYRRLAAIRAVSVSPPTSPPIGLTSRSHSTTVTRLVQEVIEAEPTLVRPASWPVGVPLVAGPIDARSI